MGVFVVSNGQQLVLNDPLPWPDSWVGGGGRLLDSKGSNIDPDAVYRAQPAVRKVVDFIARNVAQLGLLSYERVSDLDRARIDPNHPLALSLTYPSPGKSTYTMVDRFIHDLALWDRAMLLKMPGPGGTLQLRRIPPRYWVPISDPLGDVLVLRIGGYMGGGFDLRPDQVVYVSGYAPGLYSETGVTPLETLRPLLVELEEGSTYRQQLWRNGGRQSGWIERPESAPDWSDVAQTRFANDWKARWSGDGSEAGGTPILEDGMTFHGESFDPHVAEYVEGRRLTLLEVASAWHVPAVLVGAIEQATYSNLQEFVRILYADTLGPLLVQVEEALNAQLVPDFPRTADAYVEFNVQEKLRGSFEQQTQSLQSAVGRPWMSADEARARMNLSQLGGDAGELVTPLNVIVGGQASPRDSVPPSRGAARPQQSAKARAATTTVAAQRERMRSALRRHFTEQRQRVTSTLGVKSTPPLVEAFDVQHESREMSLILLRYGLAIAAAAAVGVIDEYGPDGFEFDDSPMMAYLTRAADREATGVSIVTFQALAAVLADPDVDNRSGIANVFDILEGARCDQITETATTEDANLGRSDAGKAIGLRRKVWSVTSENPRASHAELDGETVDVADTFSNGARWPGDASLDVGERAGCTCRLDFTTEE